MAALTLGVMGESASKSHQHFIHRLQHLDTDSLIQSPTGNMWRGWAGHLIFF